MRVDNWPAHLHYVIESYRTQDFVWGKSDCVCFTADCIHAITGYDFLKDYRGRYDSEESALRFIGEYPTLEEGVISKLEPLNPQRCDTRTVMRGDLVMLEVYGRLSCAIWIGRCALAPLPSRGLSEVPKEFVKSCWRIG